MNTVVNESNAKEIRQSILTAQQAQSCTRTPSNRGNAPTGLRGNLTQQPSRSAKLLKPRAPVLALGLQPFQAKCFSHGYLTSPSNGPFRSMVNGAWHGVGGQCFQKDHGGHHE